MDQLITISAIVTIACGEGLLPLIHDVFDMIGQPTINKILAETNAGPHQKLNSTCFIVRLPARTAINGITIGKDETPEN